MWDMSEARICHDSEETIRHYLQTVQATMFSISFQINFPVDGKANT